MKSKGARKRILMASAVAFDVYLIQLEDIDIPKTTAGSLWLLDSDKLISEHETGNTDSCLYVKGCSINDPQHTWKNVSFQKECEQFFSKVDPLYFHLLLAVTKNCIRLKLFKRNQRLLKWAATLSAGSRVSVWVRNSDVPSSEYHCLAGVTRYVGPLKPDTAGCHFGIELDPQFEGQGTSSGEFKKQRYFDCKEDCAVFVSIDKLEPLQFPYSSHSDGTCTSDQSRGSSSEMLVVQRSFPDVVQTCALAINDRVVWMSDDGPEPGTVRWIGGLPNAVPPRDASQLTVGVEFDNPVGSGTGRYHSQTLFTAKRRHASLVPIVGLLKESDLNGFSSGQQLSSFVRPDSKILPHVLKQSLNSEHLNGLDSATGGSSIEYNGCVLPPSIADADVLCGVNRGIQSYSNTCSLESVIFVLFSFYSYFDKQLFSERTDNLAGAVKSILVEQIVNPLRATYFVSRDKMCRFSDLFTAIQSAKLAGCATSSVTLSDDPSGTVSTVLEDILQIDPLLTLVHGSSFVYDVEVVQTPCHFPSLQHIIEWSVVKNPNRRLLQHPQSVFIVSVDAVRFGKLVACSQIFPDLILDISGIVHFAIHSCRNCGQQGSCICENCFTTENMCEGTDVCKLSRYVFCEECFNRHHKSVGKRDHQPLIVSAPADISSCRLQEGTLLELFAVISFINEHYVSFLKVGVGDMTTWLMYDAKVADRLASGDNSQLFVPEIKCCQEIETWLKDIPASQRADSLPDIIVKLTSGLRMCFYRSTDAYKRL